MLDDFELLPTIDESKFFVYRNLHKNRYSLRQEGLWIPEQKKFRKRVVAHPDYVILLNATFKVSQAGRLRVIKEKRKNVHAGVLGDLFYSGNRAKWDPGDTGQLLYYNPYKTKGFSNKNGAVVKESLIAYLTPKGVYAYG